MELIEWGRETWRDAPEDPDADLYMFDPVVGRGVRALYLNSIMDVGSPSPSRLASCILSAT